MRGIVFFPYELQIEFSAGKPFNIGRVAVIEKGAYFLIECFNGAHVFIAELEIKNLNFSSILSLRTDFGIATTPLCVSHRRTICAIDLLYFVPMEASNSFFKQIVFAFCKGTPRLVCRFPEEIFVFRFVVGMDQFQPG